MSRVQLALNVDDLERSVAFYTRLLGVEPAKRRPGYANFAVAEPPLKLVLLENPGSGGSLDHLGVEVEGPDEVRAHTERLTAAGLLGATETGTTCCYATQDKVWTTAPDGERWEHYAVLADSATFRAGPASAGEEPDAPAAGCCAPAPAGEIVAACC